MFIFHSLLETLKYKKSYFLIMSDGSIQLFNGQRPNVIEHLVIPITEGQIVWSIASTPIK